MMAKTAKYFIYHIPGVKIGVSKNPEYRVTTRQGFNKYEILEEHTNIKVVSKREIELQKQYGYPVDKKLYWKVVQMQKKSQTKEVRKKAIANTDYLKIDYKARNAKIDFKANVTKIDWKSSRAKAVANTDYKAIVAKINWKIKAEKSKKSINQYDLEGNFIKQWDSALDAAVILFQVKTHQANIAQCCKGKLKTAYKFIWKYAN